MSDLMLHMCYFSNIVKCWTGDLIYRSVHERIKTFDVKCVK